MWRDSGRKPARFLTRSFCAMAPSHSNCYLCRRASLTYSDLVIRRFFWRVVVTSGAVKSIHLSPSIIKPPQLSNFPIWTLLPPKFTNIGKSYGLADLPKVLGESFGGFVGGSLGARRGEHIVENVRFRAPRAAKPWKTYSLANPGLRNG